ncbi:MAG: hypothetical protein ACFFD9_07635, partial [Candidatus Thorarchaeota archaeon]
MSNSSCSCRIGGIGVVIWLVLVTGLSVPVADLWKTNSQSDDLAGTKDHTSLGVAAEAFNPAKSFNRTFGGVNFDVGARFVECSDGGYAIVGTTSSFGAGNSDVWLVRTDSTGKMMWNQTYGGASSDVGRALVELSDGGFALLAETESFGAGQWDFWLLRTDENGNLLWNRTYGGDLRDHGTSILQHIDGGLVLMGMTTSFGGADKDMWLVHTDSMGNHIWNYTYGGFQINEGQSMVGCGDGGFAIVGYSDESGSRDLWLVRTDSDGSQLWERRYDKGEWERGQGIVECGDGGFVLAGNVEDPVTRASDMWLLRTNGTGHHEWDRLHAGVGNDFGYAVTERSDGGFAVAGFTNSSGAGNQDAWLMFTNSTGHHIWNQTYGGSEYDNSISMLETAGESYVLVGYTWSYGMGDADMWIVIVPRVVWEEIPTSQTSEFGLVFRYDLNATSPAGIDRWWVNDSIHFAVNHDGVITSIANLGSVGTIYGLQLSVNDTLGNVLTAAFNVTVGPDVSGPSWLELPSDQFVEFGEDFLYDVNATDPSGLNQWWVDDTIRFTVDWAGRIRSIEPLSIGPYGLTIYVSDIHDSVRSVQFTVWVQDTLPPSWMTAPSNQVLEWDESLSYQLAAWDASGIY